MNNEKTIDILNNLVLINNDRIEGYETALKQTEEADLISLFAQLIATSHKCNTELGNEIIKLGGTPKNGTKVTGKLFIIWMDVVKAALTGKDRKAILQSCEFGEDAALKTYKDVLKYEINDLTAEQKTLVQNQYNILKEEHDNIRGLREILVLSDHLYLN
jgi:uncharacterized protein (TIGR02284 family)